MRAQEVQFSEHIFESGQKSYEASVCPFFITYFSCYIFFSFVSSDPHRYHYSDSYIDNTTSEITR